MDKFEKAISSSDEKKSETELAASVLKKKRSKTHKRLKERYLTGRNRTRHANFREGPIFQATCNVKTGIQTINFNLSCVSWMWEVGRRKRARD